MTGKGKVKFPSELRYDLVSKNWVVIATGRAKRPETFKKERRRVDQVSKKKCPFCNLASQEKPTLIYVKGRSAPLTTIPDDWTAAVIPNKYPAFIPSKKLERRQEGNFYQTINAVGFHEVVLSRDHQKSLGQFTPEEVKEMIDVYQDRYLALKDKTFVSYISIFHNHGQEAGASIAHPHSQIITTPLIDVDLRNALNNARDYSLAHKECIYCQMNKWEARVQKRVVFENEGFLVVCPFASKSAFQMIISPKKHLAYFERADDEEKRQFAEAFGAALKKLHKGLADPAYNFYMHTAPCDDQEDYFYYHWHWTILPKTATWAGFELGAGIEISTIEPERAAQYLKKQ